MYNPFVPFNLQLLLALRTSGQQYLVRENFPLGAPRLPHGFKASVLLSDYQHFEDAQRHLKRILFDRRAFVYDLDDSKNYQRLEIAATGLSGYLAFASRIPAPWQHSTPDFNDPFCIPHNAVYLHIVIFDHKNDSSCK